MFCGKCGNPVDEDAMFCANCGAPVEKETTAPAAEPVAPVAEPAAPVEEAPVYPEFQQEPTAEETVQDFVQSEYPELALNTEGEVSKPKKKISAIPFLIGGAAVVVVAVLLAIFNWTNVSGFFTRTFSSPEKLQSKVYEDVISDTFDKLTVSEKEQKEAAVDLSNMGVESEIRFNIDEQILNMIPTEGMDISWLSDIAIKADVSLKDKLEKVAMDLILGDTSIIGAELIADLESMEYYVSVPELNDQAIYMDMASMFDEMGTIYPSIYDPENLEKIAEVLPSAEVLEGLVNRYVGLLMSGFGKVEKSNEKVKISGVTQNLHVLKATMDEDDLVKLAENLLKTLKKDDDIEDILLNIEELTGEEGIYDSFVEAMDEALESMDEDDMELPSFKLTLTTYLNDANDIVGISAKVSTNMGMKVTIEPFSWVRVEQGKKFASELVISGGELAIVFEGKGENGKTTNSEYTLSYAGDELLTVEVKDYVSNEEQVSGTVRIVPSEYVMDMFMEEADLSQAVIDLIGTAEPALEMKIDSNGQVGNVSYALTVGTKNLVAISINSKVTTADSIVLPEKYVEMTADSDGSEWMETMNPEFLDTLMDRLIEAGVPAELFAFMG